MPPQRISVVYLRQLAGWIINHNLTSSAESEMEFRAHFGLSTSSVFLLWNQLVDAPRSRVPANTKLKHLLWTLLYLKVYPTEFVLCRMVKTNRKTLRTWIGKMLDAIFGLVPQKVGASHRCLIGCFSLT